MILSPLSPFIHIILINLSYTIYNIILKTLMEQDYYAISTNYQNQVLKYKKNAVRTIRDLKLEVAKDLNLDYGNVRVMKNGKTITDSDDAEMTSVVKIGDDIKVLPFNIKGTAPDIKLDIKRQEEKHREEEKKQQKRQTKPQGGKSQEAQKERRRLENVRRMAEEHRIEMELKKKELEDRRQYDHKDPNVFFKFSKQDIDPQDGPHLPMAEIPKVDISVLKKAPEIDYYDNPIKREKIFIKPKDEKDEKQAAKQEMFRKTGAPYPPDYMLKHHMDPFNHFGKNRGADKSDAYKIIDSQSQDEKSEEEKKIDVGPVLFGDDSEPPRDEDPPQYTYRKVPPPNMTPAQKEKRCWMRLVSLDVKDPDYWTFVSEQNQQIGQAMFRTNAPQMEPIVAIQIQRHVMRVFLKKMKNQAKVLQNIEYYKTIPGLLEYCFDSRLCHPVQYLKLLMRERRKQFCRIFRDWYDYDATEVFSQQEQENYIKELSKHTDSKIAAQLIPITGSQQQALKLTQISQNDLQAAIQYFLKGNKPEVLEETRLLVLTDWQRQNVDKIAPWQEQMFLYRWYRKYESYYIRLRLQGESDFLEIYALSMKHICPSLYKLLVKNVPFMRKIIAKYPAERLKLKRLPKKIKEYNYIRIIQV